MEQKISTEPINFKLIGLILTILIDGAVVFMTMYFHSPVITILIAISILLVLGSISILLPNTRMVLLGENYLIISSYFKKEKIEADNIKEFRKTIFIPGNGYKSYFYKVSFYNNTDFGKEVWFLSKAIGIFRDDTELKKTLLTFIKNNSK